eukprot:2097257-Rhodomonas_salina.5
MRSPVLTYRMVRTALVSLRASYAMSRTEPALYACTVCDIRYRPSVCNYQLRLDTQPLRRVRY